MDNVQQRMEQIEQEILTKVRPFEQTNRQKAQEHLEELDMMNFEPVAQMLQLDKRELLAEDIGKILEQYFKKMESAEFNRVSDADQMTFLVKKLPKNF